MGGMSKLIFKKARILLPKLINMDDLFYKEEVRCGHTVTSQMKRLWAVEMGCLTELKRICEKHGIRYFVSGGTLLGAIRHKGFIPWDDDVDVVMMADDYYRFCEIAPKELKHPYFFQDFNTESGFGPSKARIRNSETTGCTKFDYEIADENYNCGCFIDIFPMFGVEKGIFRLFRQKLLMRFRILPITGYEMWKKSQRQGKLRWYMLPFILCWWIASLLTDHKGLCRRYIKACGIANHYDEVGLLPFSGFNRKWIWKKEWYKDIVNMPFEYTDISCPSEYDLILRQQFGDYSVFVKADSNHTMMLWDPDTPYKDKMVGIIRK